MKTVVMAGASGVVGARALEHLLAHGDVARVLALGRRPLSVQHPKLESRVVDMQSATALASEIPADVGIAVCCLGTTMKQAGSKAAFRAVDHDAVVAFGQAARQRGAERFLLVSAIGVSARSSNFYLETKGKAEEALSRLGFPQLTTLRPSFIDDQGARTEHRILEQIGLPISRALFSIIGKTHRYAPITADVIARALVRLAFDETPERWRVVESDQLHRLGR